MAYKEKYKGTFPILPKHGKNSYFKKGDKGISVKQLQTFLNWANAGTIVKRLEVDGDYGELTERAVKFFQEVHHIVADGEFGNVSLKTAKAMYMTGALKAVNWAVSVSKDNSFSYGVGDRAHRGGCYFCQTNTGKRMYKKEKKGEPHYVNSKGKKWHEGDGKKYTYEKTYCCNPFVFAAYAHGTEDPKIHAACRKGKCGGMSPRDWTKYGCFKKVGRCKDIAFKNLQDGDVIICNKSHHHVWMYTGGNHIVEASGANFGKDSIRHHSGAKDRYHTYQKDKTAYVMRYTK